MKTTIGFSLVLTLAVCAAITARASLVTATLPSSQFGTVVQEGFDIGTFNYVIPHGDTITGATLQLNTFYTEYNNVSDQSFVYLYINGGFLGDFSSLYPGYNLLINLPGAYLSGLSGGSATVSWSIPAGEYFSGDPAVTFNGATLTMNVVPEPTTMAAGALMLLPFGAGAVQWLRRKQTA